MRISKEFEGFMKIKKGRDFIPFLFIFTVLVLNYCAPPTVDAASTCSGTSISSTSFIVNFISVLLFFAIPSAVLLLAIGFENPNPSVVTLSFSTPLSIR